MLNRIHNYIDEAFSDAPDTKKVRELKEELCANLIEKYNDNLTMGKSEADSYAQAVASVGDIDEIVESLKLNSPLLPVSSAQRQKSAIIVSISVALYILCPLPVILFTVVEENPVIGVCLMFIFIATATMLIIYNSMTKPKYKSADETMVEEFKEFKNNNTQKNSAYKALSSGFWSLTVAVYLLVSFIFGIWAYSWVIFIIAAAVENIIKGFVNMGGDK